MDFMTYFKQLKEGKLDAITLITGEETYLIDHLIKYITENFINAQYVDFNLTEVDAISDLETTLSSALTMPFFDDRRMLIFQNSGILKNLKEDGEEKLLSFLNDFPGHLNVIFNEKEMDKRKKTYKWLAKNATIVSVDRLARPELVKWIAKRFKHYGKEISLHVTNHFIEMVNYLDPETGKTLYDVDNTIRSISGVNGDITVQIINQYVEVPIEHNIFKMMDALSARQMSDAIHIFNHFIAGGEPEIRIFFLINQQFRNILKTKLLLEAGHSSATIASKLDIHPFVAKKAGTFATQFSERQLLEIINLLEEVDIAMKSSGISPALLIEKVMFQISHTKK